MGRDYGNGLEGSSASASLSLSARSQLAENLSTGFKTVLVQNIFEDGKENAAYWLSNDTSFSIQEINIEYATNITGSDETTIRIGRTEANYPFTPTYHVRHHSQALEGIFSKTSINEHLSFDLGHIERYSSWPSRENGASSLDSTFKKIGERVGHEEIRSSVQFASAALSSNNLKINFYDYYASALYNNAALKLSYSIPSPNKESRWTVSAHAISQEGNNGGAFDGRSTDSIELNLNYKRNSLNVDTGWTHISSAASLLVPFRTSYVNDATLLWYTNQFEAGTNTLHAKAVYSHNPWVLAAVMVHADHLDGRVESELDLVAKRKMNEKLSLCVKAGYGKRVFAEDDRRHESAVDLRLFVDYQL